LLKILELVRSYSVPIRDDRVSKLITWYVKALQKAIDMIWDNIEWRYCFPELVRRGRKLITNIGLKMMIPIVPRDRASKERFRDELMKDNPYAALGKCCYQDSLLDYGELEEEISEGRARKIKPRIRRRFARCKTTLIKIDYQARTIALG
jgi:putative transposase